MHPNDDAARVAELLRLLDHEPPEVRPDDIVARARGHAVRRRTRRAAGLLFALGVGGAAWAAPGSPLPGWIDRLGTPAASPGPGSAAAAGGIAVDADRAVTILFTEPLAAGAIEVVRSAGSRVEVRTLRGSAAFASEDAGRVRVRAYDHAAHFEIRIPQAAHSVEIRIQEQAAFFIDPAGIRPDVRPDASGRYNIP